MLGNDITALISEDLDSPDFQDAFHRGVWMQLEANPRPTPIPGENGETFVFLPTEMAMRNVLDFRKAMRLFSGLDEITEEDLREEGITEELPTLVTKEEEVEEQEAQEELDKLRAEIIDFPLGGKDHETLEDELDSLPEPTDEELMAVEDEENTTK